VDGVTDRQTAAILIGISVVAFLLWYRKRSEGERATLFGIGEPGTSPTIGAKGEAAQTRAADTGTKSRISELLQFARLHNLRVTAGAGERSGHNRGSLHYLGRAIDVGARNMTDAMVENIRRLAAAVGINVIDERSRPQGQKVWTGPHLHLSFPTEVGGRIRY